jgi:hypothetical protein
LNIPIEPDTTLFPRISALIWWQHMMRKAMVLMAVLEAQPLMFCTLVVNLKVLEKLTLEYSIHNSLTLKLLTKSLVSWKECADKRQFYDLFRKRVAELYSAIAHACATIKS